jgi:hypothetical protein
VTYKGEIMSAQHKSGLERVMQSSLKHKRAGTEMATAVLGIEAMIASGIDTNEIVENGDVKAVGRCRAALCHKNFGKRLADSVTTLDQIIADEALSIEAEDKELSAQHKAGLRAVVVKSITRTVLGEEVADIADKAEKVIDELLLIYDGITKADLQAELTAIKEILNS